LRVKIRKPPYRNYTSEAKPMLAELAATGQLFEVDMSRVYDDRVYFKSGQGILSTIYVHDWDIEINIDEFRDGLLKCTRCARTFYLECTCGADAQQNSYMICPATSKRAFRIEGEIKSQLKLITMQ